MFVFFNDNNKILMSTESPELADGEGWVETEKEIVRGTDGVLYFKGELPEGVEEQPREEGENNGG